MARPLVIAHRGHSSVAPENTLAAFRSALALRVDGVEFDYRHSADSVPVVIHDETLDRTTNAAAFGMGAKQRVDQTSLSELRRLDAGGWYGPKFAQERLATVEEAIDLICGTAVAVIERKSGDAARIVELLRHKQVMDRVWLMAFDWEFLAESHRLDSKVQLVALGEGPIGGKQLSEAAACGATWIGWNQQRLSASEIGAAQARGLRVSTWTVDDESRMRELIAGGVDAITTNVPLRLLSVLASI